MPDPQKPKMREDMSLKRSQLPSSLSNQPLPLSKQQIIVAPKGHPEGHIVSTVPMKLDPGNHAFEIEIEQSGRDASNTPPCIIVALSDGKVLRNKPISFFENKARLDIDLPNWSSDRMPLLTNARQMLP